MQTPLVTLFPSKKAAKPYLVSKNRRYCRASERACCPSARAHLSLSLCVCSVYVQCATEKSSALIQFNTDIMLLASLILHAIIAEITVQQLSLSYVYLISSDDGSIIRIFVQINIFEGRAGYVVLMGCVSITVSYSFHCLTTETVKYINENSFIENLAASKYSMWAQRGKKKFINK